MLTAIVVACARPGPVPNEPGGPPAPAPRSSAHGDDSPPPSEAAPSGPASFRLPPPPGPAAAWYLPPGDRVVGPAELERTMHDAAVGQTVALVRVLGGALAVHRERGVLAAIRPPADTAWLGVDERDRILAAESDGRLWRAEDAAAARDGAFEHLATVGGAREWDVSRGIVVAATVDAVHVSRDGGATFVRAPRLDEAVGPWRVLTRSDRTIVAQRRADTEHPRTFVLRPGADAWREDRSGVGPLHRVGDWIADGPVDECVRVLARDGRRFVQSVHGRRLAQWHDLARLGPEPQPGPLARELPTLSVPAAPRRGHCPVEAGLGGGGLGLAGSGRGDEPIRGTTDPPPPRAPRWYALLSDADCVRDREQPWDCAADRPLRRPPHAAMWNEADRSLRIVELPATCRSPRELVSAGGIGVLRCQARGRDDLWTIGEDATWHAEGAASWSTEPPTSLGLGGDGTLLLHGACVDADACEPSWLRPPTALGSAWIELRDPQALAWRVLDGGQALRIAGSRAAGYDLHVVDGSTPAQVVATGLRHGDDHLRAVIVGADRSLRLELGNSWQDREALVLGADRRLVAPAPQASTPWPGVVLEVDSSWPLIGAAGDFDGDHIDDLAVVRWQPGATHSMVTILPGRRDWSGVDADALDTAGIHVVADVTSYGIRGATGLGDLDGDGRDDLLVTATRPGGTTGLRGDAYVVFGRPGGDPISLAAIQRGEGGFWIDGFPESNPYAMWAGTLGDLDGDGRHEIGLGLPLADAAAGSLYVVYGKADGTSVHLRDVARGIGGFELRGFAGLGLGHEASALDDTDGDGSSDFAVLARPEVAGLAGRIYVVRGARDRSTGSGPIEDLVAAGRAHVIGGLAEATVAAAGDVDGDGLADLLVGEPAADTHDVDTGRVVVVLGRRRPRDVELAAVARGRGGFAIHGDFAFDGAGRAVAGIGDLDGDGRAEIAVGAPELTRNAQSHGRAYVVRGRRQTKPVALADVTEGRGGFAVFATAEHQGLGERIVPLGDVDGDRRPDFAVTSRRSGGSSGAIYVVLGRED